MITIKSILLEMKLAVENGTPMSPSWWLEQALKLAALWQDLKDEVTKYEMLYKQEVVDQIELGKKISEADRIVEARSENYRTYRYLKGRDQIVEEFIRIAKKRSGVEQYE